MNLSIQLLEELHKVNGELIELKGKETIENLRNGRLQGKKVDQVKSSLSNITSNKDLSLEIHRVRGDLIMLKYKREIINLLDNHKKEKAFTPNSAHDIPVQPS